MGKKMASAGILCLTLVILGVFSLGQAETIFEKIDDRLAGLRNSKDVFGDIADLRSDLSRHDLRVLDKFLLLEKLNKNSTCNREGYEIIRNNSEIWDAHDNPNSKAMRLMNSQAIKHAKLCDSFYQSKFYSLDTNYNKAFEDVSEFFSTIKKNKLGRFSADSEAYKIKDLGSEEEIRQVYDLLVKFAEADDHPYMRYLYADVDPESGAIRENPAKIDKLFRHYFIDPCNDLIEKFGPDIFIPAMYEISTLKKESRPYGTSITRAVTADKYYKVLRDYRLCLALKRNKWSFIKGLIKISSETLA